MPIRQWIVCALASALAACGGGGGSGSSTTQPPSGEGTNDRVALSATAVSEPVPSYSQVGLEFVVSNPSTVTATNVALSVTLGNGLTPGGVECTASSGAICPTDPTTLSVASLPGGGTLRFRVWTNVPGGTTGEITNTASVSASNDTNTANNSASVSFTAFASDINIVGSTNATEFLSGALVPYSFTVSNSGPDAARNLTLETELSSGQSLASITCSATGDAVCPADTGTTLNIATLPSGESLTFAINARLSADVLMSVSGTLRAILKGDGNFANNQATATARTRVPTSPNSPSFIVLQSDTGDWVGSGSFPGRNYSYSQANAQFEVYEAHGALNVKVFGDEQWWAMFYMPASLTQITRGTYGNLRGVPGHDPETGGMSWSGEARGCSHTDTFIIDDVIYEGAEIVSVDIRFEQHCEGRTPALRGQIHWVANDQTRPPGPIDPPPAGLWHPAPGATPANGNYLYFESDTGDYVGQGRTETFTQADSVIRVTHDSAGNLNVSAIGDTSILASFQVMSPLTRMAPGYYPDVQRTMFGNPARGRMDIGHSCNAIAGWFVIDSISFSTAGEITGLDARFEQHCEGAVPALRGNVHWRSDDPTQPPGPITPPPSGLWAPPSSAIPATGNFVYIQSDSGDFIGRGLTRLYTPLDSIIDVGGGGFTPAGNRFQLTVTGDEDWNGFFQAMNTLPDLRAGYYGDLALFGSHNPTKGGLSWYGEGRACGDASGWFVIDSVTYNGSTLHSITLRFEQHCEYGTPALRGMIRWSADDTRTPAPPQNPPPTTLWDAPHGVTPASGNFVYLESQAGDFIGQGQTYLYTPLNAQILMSVSGRLLNIEALGDKRWGGVFHPMVPFTELQPGYYDLSNGGSLAKGLLEWHGDGRGCGGSQGWFVVDSVSYSSGSLTSLNLRFEQRCNPTAAALRGKIRWRSDDSTQPSGPVNPAPAGLWTAPAKAVPASGNVFYFESDSGDHIGRGRTVAYTPASVTFSSATFQSEFMVSTSSATLPNYWLSIDRMYSIPRLQPGYYPNTQRTLLHNPSVGGLDFGGDARSCETVDGWFVIHSITYTGETVTAIDVTFQQFCNGLAGASSRGRVRWSQ